MLPQNLLQYHLAGDDVVPHYLTPRDHTWLREVVTAFDNHLGLPASAWHDRKAAGWSVAGPDGKRNMAIAVLEGCAFRQAAPTPAPPARVRQQVFAAAARQRGTACPDWRDAALAEAGAALDCPPAALDAALFADLGGARLWVAPEPLPDLAALADRVNLMLVQGLLNRSVRVDIQLRGRARGVVRQVHLRRLIAVARPGDHGATHIEVSGVFSLFRRTTLYGRALASVVPVLVWCDDFQLDARLALGPREARLRLGPHDPLARGVEPTAYDSKLEAAFARAVARKCPDWELVREPQATPVDGTLVFPDFELRHRGDASRRALVEIVGFWTPEYLEDKLGRLRRAGRSDLVLCVDQDRCAAAAELAPGLSVVPFRRRIDPLLVIAAIERLSCGAAPPLPKPTLGLADLHLDHAGRASPDDPIHGRLAALQPHDPVTLRQDGGRVWIDGPSGPIAVLSRPGARRHAALVAASPPLRVLRLVRRTRAQTAPEWRALLRRDAWWVPVVGVD